MILYQCGTTGKTIRLNSIDDLLNLNEQELIANSSGFEINNPFYKSTLNTPEGKEDDDEDEILFFELPDISGLPEIELDEEWED